MDLATQRTYRTRITLLQKVQLQHNDAAWKEFYEQYRNFVFAMICRMNIREDDAEDLIQEVFLKLWKQIPQIELAGVRRFRSYLAGFTRNCICDHFRREMGRTGQKKAANDIYIRELERITPPEIEEIAEEEWENYLGAQALENVSKHFSKTAVLVFEGVLAGREIRDVANELGIGVSTAYRLRGRFLESLIDEIEALKNYLR